MSLRLATALALAALGALAPARAAAEDIPEEIVVTATRAPAPLARTARSLSLLGPAQLQHATRGLGLDEALAGIPGLELQNRDNYAQDLRLSLRGFGARAAFGIRGIRLLVDGIPQTLPDGQTTVDAIDPGSIERIEVLRGPASALYGNAAGGVIAIDSGIGGPAALSGTAAVGGDGYRRLQLRARGSVRGAGYLASLSRQRLDGYRDHAALRGTVLNSGLTLPAGGGTVDLRLRHVEQPRAEDPGGLVAAEAARHPRRAAARNLRFDAGERLRQQLLGVRYRRHTAAGLLTLRGHGLRRAFANRLPFAAGGAVDLSRRVYGAGLQFSPAGLPAPLALTLGLDQDLQRDDRQRFDNQDGRRGARVFDQRERVSALGLYAQAQLRIGEPWTVSAGLRHDRLRFAVDDHELGDGDDSGRRRFGALSANAGLHRRLGHGGLFAAWSSAFETPTATELARPDARGGFSTTLQPQQAQNQEIGYRLAHGPLRAELALYRIELRDELVPFELAAFPGRTFYRNAGASRRRGLETALSWALGHGFGLDLSFTAADFRYRRFRTDDADHSGRRQPGQPARSGRMALRYAGTDGWQGLLAVRYRGPLYADDANAVRVGGHATVQLRITRSLRRGAVTLRPYLGLDNLLDRRHADHVRSNAFGGRHFEPAAGRQFYGGLTIGIGDGL